MRGQVFTPPAVADFMVGWVLGSGTREVFDPCFGMGAFFDAARRCGRPRFEGMEIDPGLLSSWRRGRRGAGPARLVEGDYLRSWEPRRGNIVCNPPYLRFQQFPDREAVRDDFARRLEHRLSGYTNAAAAFLLKSLWELGEGRRLAYLMPLEFLNTGYGVGVKRRLLRFGDAAGPGQPRLRAGGVSGGNDLSRAGALRCRRPSLRDRLPPDPRLGRPAAGVPPPGGTAHPRAGARPGGQMAAPFPAKPGARAPGAHDAPRPLRALPARDRDRGERVLRPEPFPRRRAGARPPGNRPLHREKSAGHAAGVRDRRPPLTAGSGRAGSPAAPAGETVGRSEHLSRER